MKKNHRKPDEQAQRTVWSGLNGRANFCCLLLAAAGLCVGAAGAENFRPAPASRNASTVRINTGGQTARPAQANTAKQDAAEAASPDNLVQLDGSASSDSDGDQLTYQWRQVGGPQVRLLNAASARPSFYARQPGKYSFELVVSDGKISSEPAVVNIEVDKINHTPALRTEPRISAMTGEMFVLDASRTSDEDGDALRYYWRQVSGPAKLTGNVYTDRPGLNLRTQNEGVYIFEVVASDGSATSAPQQCEVRVTRPNAAPVAKVNNANERVMIRQPAAGGFQPESAAARPAAPARDNALAGYTPVDDPLDRAVNEAPEANLNNIYNPRGQNSGSAAPEDASVRRPPSAQPRATASAQAEETNPAGAAGEVKELTASTSPDMQVEVGQRVLIRGYGMSPEGRRLNYRWNQTAGLLLSRDILNRSKDLEFIPAEPGTYIFELTVNDGHSFSRPAVVKVNVAGVHENLMGMAPGLEKGDSRQYNNVNNIDIPGVDPVPVKREETTNTEESKNTGLFSRILNKVTR